MGLRERLCAAVAPIVTALDPAPAVRTALADMEVSPARLLVLALGKAAPAMARGAVAALGVPRAGLVVAAAPAPAGPLPVLVGDHPVPGPASLVAGSRLLEVAATAGPGDTVIALVSGGGSALAEAPVAGMSIEDIASATRHMLRSGLAIEAINARRRQWSRLKGGGLARACGKAKVVTLVVSDIPGGDAVDVASGPTVDEGALEAGRHVLQPILGPADAAGIAQAELARLRIEASVAATPLTGDAGRRGTEMAAALLAGGGSTIYAGETTVAVTGDGRGGRNQHLALAAAVALEGADGVALLALATDGVDGPTPAAGAAVDGGTVHRLGGAAAAREALARCDSHHALQRSGDVVTTGSTGSNVADLVVAAVDG